MPQVLMVASAVIGTASVVSQYKDAKDAKNAAKANERANERARSISEKRSNIQQRQARLQEYRQRLKANDEAVMFGVGTTGGMGTGGTQSSSALNSISSIAAQYGYNAGQSQLLDSSQTALNNIKPINMPSGTLSAGLQAAGSVVSSLGGDDLFKDYTKNFFKQ
jgi:hypothetical protein